MLQIASCPVSDSAATDSEPLKGFPGGGFLGFTVHRKY